MKKYLTWDYVLGVLLFVGLTVASVAFVHYSYAWAEEYPLWLERAMRIVGFIGTLYFPAKLVWVITERRNDEIIDELQSDYNELWARDHRAGVPDDADYIVEGE